MDEHDYQRLLHDPNTFHPSGEASCIEAWTFSAQPLTATEFSGDKVESRQTSGHSRCGRRKIPEDEVQAWWSNTVG
jgi:hypothetical protein